MAKNTIVEMSNEELEAEITRLETMRTENYIKFQIAQANELLAPFANSDKPKICYAHLLDWKKKLQAELAELRGVPQKPRHSK